MPSIRPTRRDPPRRGNPASHRIARVGGRTHGPGPRAATVASGEENTRSDRVGRIRPGLAGCKKGLRTRDGTPLGLPSSRGQRFRRIGPAIRPRPRAAGGSSTARSEPRGLARAGARRRGNGTNGARARSARPLQIGGGAGRLATRRATAATAGLPPAAAACLGARPDADTADHRVGRVDPPGGLRGTCDLSHDRAPTQRSGHRLEHTRSPVRERRLRLRPTTTVGDALVRFASDPRLPRGPSARAPVAVARPKASARESDGSRGDRIPSGCRADDSLIRRFDR